MIGIHYKHKQYPTLAIAKMGHPRLDEGGKQAPGVNRVANFGFSRIRSAIWIALLVPFLVLPYRWLWLPCGLGAMLLVVHARLPWPVLVHRHGIPVFGGSFVLVLRTALDPGWWLPWIVVLLVVLWLRSRSWWQPALLLPTTPALWIISGCILGRPAGWLSAGELTQDIDASTVLVCAGDSLTSGLDSDSDSGTYVARLRGRLGCTVINSGFPGNRAGDLLGRLERDVLSRRPAAVLVFIGGNDYLGGTPRRQFAQALEATVARVAGAGCRLVVVEVPTGFIWNPYAGLYRRIARKYQAVLVPESALRWWLMLELLARDHLDEPLTLDGLHLSRAGATRVGTWLEPYIVQVLVRR